jgi:hypothetical protein
MICLDCIYADTVYSVSDEVNTCDVSVASSVFIFTFLVVVS